MRSNTVVVSLITHMYHYLYGIEHGTDILVAPIFLQLDRSDPQHLLTCHGKAMTRQVNDNYKAEQ